MKIGINVVNQVGLGDFIAITPLLKKLNYIFDQKITIFGYRCYQEFIQNNSFVDEFYVHGEYDLDVQKNYKIYYERLTFNCAL